jgi:hypothetical protein
MPRRVGWTVEKPLATEDPPIRYMQVGRPLGLASRFSRMCLAGGTRSTDPEDIARARRGATIDPKYSLRMLPVVEARKIVTRVSWNG